MERVSNTPRASSETTSGAVAPAGAPKLLDRVRQSIRAKHYSRRTESAYVDWIRRFIFHGKRHPSDMGASEVAAFLTWLATDRRVAASTQNQALSALLFPVSGRTAHGDWSDRACPSRSDARSYTCCAEPRRGRAHHAAPRWGHHGSSWLSCRAPDCGCRNA